MDCVGTVSLLSKRKILTFYKIEAFSMSSCKFSLSGRGKLTIKGKSQLDGVIFTSAVKCVIKRKKRFSITWLQLL